MTLIKSPVRKGHCWVGYGPTGVPLFQIDAKTLAANVAEYARAIAMGSDEALQWPPLCRERDRAIGIDIPIVWKRSDLVMEPGVPQLHPENGEMQNT